MNCQTCRIEIEELMTGEGLSKEARTHLERCSPCQAFYDERMSLRKLVGSLEPVAAPPDFEFRLRARLAAAGSAGSHRFSLRSFIASGPALSLAASFALLVGAIVVYNHFKSGPATATQQSTLARQNSEPTPTTLNGKPSQIDVSNPQPVISVRRNRNDSSSTTIPVRVDSASQRVAESRKRNVRQPRLPDGGSAQQIVTNDSASRSAPKITPANGSQVIATSSPLVELPVRPSSQAVRVFVDDRSGGKRSVTLEPVIFGSQDFTGRNDSRPQGSQGIW